MSIDPNEFLAVVRPALAQSDAAAVADAVRQRWRPCDVCSLLTASNVDARRVAAVVAGLIGDRACLGPLARALHDKDEQVNEMAEHGLWAIWFRSGHPKAAQPFHDGIHLLSEERYDEALKKFQQAIAIDPDFAEAYNQCALAWFFLGGWGRSIGCCRQALCRMPTHFGAMAGMGHCHTHLDQLDQALLCYQRSLAINPRMPGIADAIERLQGRLGRIASR